MSSRDRRSRRCTKALRRNGNRARLFETLEPRMMLNADWHNRSSPLDVNNDWLLTPMDALLVINRLNSDGSGVLPVRSNTLDFYYDVNGDQLSSPMDVLLIINQLNQGGARILTPTYSEGEAGVSPAGFISVSMAKLPGVVGQSVALSTRIEVGQKEFNELGLFVVDGPDGSVQGILPSSPEYAAAVFQSSQRQALYSRASVFQTEREVVLPAGRYISVYVLQQYSSNGEPADHLRVRESVSGSMQIGWEAQMSVLPDWPVVGDRGYDDVTVDVEFGEPFDGNSQPVITAIPNQTIDELTELSIQLTVVDPDSAPGELTWSKSSGPAGLQVDSQSGMLTWTPSENDGPGQFEVTVSIFDGALSNSRSFMVRVDEVNVAPTIATISEQVVGVGATLSVTAVATDTDIPSNALTYRLDASPADATIDSQSGLIQWSPSAAGAANFVVRATDAGGLFATTSFRVTAGDNSLMTEGSAFQTELSRELTLPNDASALRVTFEAPLFDFSSKQTIRDAFEIEVTDLDGNPLTFPYAPNRDAVYNWSEGLSPVFGAGVATTTNPSGQPSSATINLSGLAPGTRIRAIARLVNNDSDVATSVLIRGFEVIPASGVLPAGVPGANSRVADFAALEISKLSDISGSFVPSYGRTTLAGDNNQLVVELLVTNRGNQTTTGRVIVAIDNISEPNAHAMRPDGFLPDGRPYFDVTADINGGALAPGETLRSREVRFLNDSGQRFSYRLSVLGEINTAPTGFDSVPLAEIEADRTYRYQSHAVDVEEQTLTYSVTTGPETLTVDASTGLVTWPTIATDIGRNQVTLRATDSFGLFVEQSFDIQVYASLQNRPPVFVSTPETEAIAGSGFEVSTVQAGQNPVGVAVANIGLDNGTIVTINRGTQTLSQIVALGNDRYELPKELTVGEPGPVDQILRSGYNIDVGLPPYLQQFEGNSIRGMDQADLNGDGLLDVVISAQVQTRIPSTVYAQVINVVFGEGDGKFSEPVTLASTTTNNASNPRTLKLADFDQDGTVDILALNVNTASLYLLRGAGDGSFSPVEVMAIATTLNDFKTADLNQDGILDLVGAASDTRSLGYMLGNGDGTFTPFTSTFTSTNRIFDSSFPGRNYATSDIDGDGDIDIVFSHFQNGTINVLANDGNLNFTLAASLVARRPFGSDSQSASIYSVFAGDFNGDALVDIAYGALGYTSNDTGSLGMFIRDSSGFTFTYKDGVDSIARYPGNWAGNSDPIDIDGDGDLDILVAGVAIGSTFESIPSVLRNRGDGTFTASNLSLPFDDKSPFEITHNDGATKGILAGDYNADGMLDLIAFKSENSFASSTYSTVSVILADRPGEFASSDILHYTTPSGNNPQRFFETGDFNNDGIVDLWSPAYQGTSKTWLGRGDGTFDDPIIATPYIGNEGLRKGFVGDFDQDGNLDVFWRGGGGVQSGPSSRFLAALGNGDGTFRITYTFSSATNATVPGDFNGDGYTDFATRNENASLDIYLYDVANPGTWQPGYSFALSSLGSLVGNYREILTVADFNQDGKLDLATVYQRQGGDFQLAVLTGVGDGTFAFPKSSPYGISVPNYSAPAELTSGDLNEDGIADVVVYDSSAIGVHLGLGDGTFGTPMVIPANDPRQLYGHVFVKDFDYDGHQDILFTSSLNLAQLNFLRGDGTGNFAERVTYAPPLESGYVEFGDLDNDGRDEVIVSDPTGTNFASILYAARERLTDVVSADLNGDGNHDVLATNFDNSRIKLFLGNNLGQLVKQPDLLTDNGPAGLIVADFNRDAANEIVTVNRSGRSISIFSGSVDSFARTDIPVGRTPIAVTAGLIDADSNQDLLVLDEGLNTVWYLKGNNDLSFATPIPIPLGDRPNDVLAGDINNDGFTDIVVSLPDTNRLMILPGDGTGYFGVPTYVALAGSPTAIGFSDFNQDGRVDLAVAIGGLDQVAILYGRGQLQFAKPQSIFVGDQPVSLKISDADGDGRDDIMVANQGDNTASIIFNRFDPTKVYRYNALAIDPDDDSVSYELVDSPGGMILDATTGRILWAPSAEQIGSQLVTIAASDGRGGVGTQSFHIDVAPARENSAPLISTLPITTVSAEEVFSYPLQATDRDNNPLRYRLLDGPEGSTVDPVSGLVTWDARQAALRANEYTQISQTILVPPTAALQPASVTAEGWFKFDELSNSEYLIRKANGFSGNSYRLSITSGMLRATVGSSSSSSNDVFVDYDLNREVGRWYHLAMTFDDATKRLSLLVDGKVVATTTANLTIAYSTSDIEIAGPAAKFSGQIGSIRIWNQARSQALLQQSMSLDADSSDPSLVLDLDFNATEAQTLRDESSYQHVAVRTGTGNIYAHRTPGLAFEQTAPFIVSVEDGRGGYDQQSFNVTYVVPLRGGIAGTLFDDQSGDGAKQVGEPALANWLVYVDLNGNQYPDPNEPNAISNIAGHYQFDKLLPGSYPLQVQPRAGFATPPLASVDVVANQQNTVDFAIEQLALGQIRGQVTTITSSVAARWKVFADLDDNGLLDPDEPFTSTDDLGNFAITGLDAGEYRLRAEMLPGWQVTEPTNKFVDVSLDASGISTGNNFVIKPSSTTASSGLQFVTTPNSSGATDAIAADVTYRYDSLAIGLLKQPVRYDLSLAPEGMSIDPATGLLLWRPSLTQLGEQHVIVRAMDELDGVALQDFVLNVASPNTAPYITSAAPTQAYVGIAARYSIQAQDADNEPLTYGLVSGPATASVDSSSGKLTWTPTTGNVGLNNFVVSVADTSGNVTLQAFVLNVFAATPTTTPFALNPLRTQAAINQPFRSQAVVFDAIGRSLPVSLVSGPTGLTLDTDGNINWLPSTSLLGVQSLVLSAIDGVGNSQQFTVSLTVAQRLVNTSPQVTSDPAFFAVANQTYVYNVAAVDTENDRLAFELLESPVGMSINSETGALRWSPSRPLVGEHAMIIRVTDAVGAETRQSFVLRVRAAGGPPQITSVPPTEAAVGSAWLYTVTATDVEQDPLTYSLLTGPEGVSIDAVTGELSWTPRLDQLGLNAIAIQVSDGSGGSTSQSFAIRVAAGIANLPPTMTTQPNRFATVGTAYSYLPTAIDPEGQAIVYTLRRAPTTMTVNPTTGQINWIPAAGDVGKVIVTLVAIDAGGAAAVQSVELDVLAANQLPTIISSPDLSIAAGATWRYTVVGRDTDLDPLRYEMIEAPTGAIIDAFGEVEWSTSVANIGSHAFRFRVSDPRGGVVEQSFTLEVVADTVAPRVTVLPDKVNPFPWGGPIHVYVSAVDNVAIASVTMTVNGRDVPLDANNHAALYVEDWGYAVLNIVATATDTAGNVGQGQGVTYYNDPEVDGDTNAPTATISSPVESASVTGFVDIVGTAAGANVNGYRLLYRRIDQPEANFTVFASATAVVTDGVLGRWDTSLLNNDEYIIRLEVSNQSGRTNIVDRQVGLSGGLKLGNFQLSFTDMVIPVAGIPIEITRIYDTLQADRQGDFGYGWRLEYRNTDLRVGLPKSGLEDIGIYSPLRPGVKVYVNIPGQGRQGFTFTPEIRVLPGFGGNLVVARPKFTPDRGVTSNLSTGTNSYLLVNEQDELFSPGGMPYNPASPDFGGAFFVTDEAGIVYRINGASGQLDWATDRDGNKLTFTDRGIFSSNSDIAVTFVRDTFGRVTGITNLEGDSTTYKYSTNGDLVEVTDAEGNLSSLSYSATRPHFLTNVVDPLNRDAVRTEYNEEGRLVALVDPAGNRVAIESDTILGSTRVTDPLGNSTLSFYDGFGNTVLYQDQLGNSITATYDSQGNRLSTTDSLGNTTRYRFNAAGKQVAVIDAAGYTSSTEFNPRGDITSEIDAQGNVESFQVDIRGNITQISSENFSTAVKFNNNGSFQQLSGAVNISNILTDAFGNVTSSTRSDGTVTTGVFDRVGRLLQLTETRNGLPVITTFAYDSLGNLIETVDPFGGVTRTTYDAGGRVIASVDPLGRTTRFEYDDRNLLVKQVLPTAPGVSEEFQGFEYDLLGRLTAEIDALGRRTEYQYDVRGLLLETILPDGTTGDLTDNPRILNEYDAAGRLISVTNRGRRSEFIYDNLGQVVREIQPDGTEILNEYDGLGRLTRVTRPGPSPTMPSIVKYKYSAEGAILETTLPNGQVLFSNASDNGRSLKNTNLSGNSAQIEFDDTAQIETYINELGNGYRFERTVDGRISTITDPDGNVVRYDYDPEGRLTGEQLPLGQGSSRTLDLAGNLLEVVAFDGTVKRYQYDLRNRLTRTQIGSESAVLYRYDAADNLVELEDTRGVTSFEYDAEDRLIRQSNPDGTYIAYKYDLAGNRVEIATANGETSYSYDVLNRVVLVRDSGGRETHFAYNAAGSVSQVMRPNGVSESFVYDQLGRVVEKVFTRAGTTFESFAYHYDSAGSIASIFAFDGTITTYKYDLVGQVVEELQVRNGELLFSTQFQYGPSGDRTRETTRSMMGNGSIVTVVRDSSYDENGRLISIRTDDGAAISIRTFDYDERGNEVASYVDGLRVRGYQWDSEGRLIGVDTDGNGTADVTYQYDPFGNRIARTSDGVTTTLLVDSNRASTEVLEEVDWAGNLVLGYTYTDDAPISLTSANDSIEYLHTDSLGSVRFITDTSGATTDTYRYSAFGEVVERTGTSSNSVLFAGQQRDSLTGLDNLRARNFDSSLGRFISRDRYLATAEQVNLMNRYNYASNNPVSFTDPSGFNTVPELSVVGSIGNTINKARGVLRTVKRAKTNSEIVAQLIFFAEAAYIYSQLDSYLSPTIGKLEIAPPELEVETRLNLWVKKIKLAINPLKSPTETDLGFNLGKLDDSFGGLAGTIGVKFAGTSVVEGGFAFTKPLIQFPKAEGTLQGFLLTIELQAGVKFDGTKIGAYDAADLAITGEITALATIKYKMTFFSLAEIARAFNSQKK